jgi:flagellar protein FlbD
MIQVTKLNGSVVYVNPDLIRFVESTPDTILTFTDNTTLMVKEQPKDVIEKVVGFRRQIAQQPISRS